MRSGPAAAGCWGDARPGHRRSRVHRQTDRRPARRGRSRRDACSTRCGRTCTRRTGARAARARASWSGDVRDGDVLAATVPGVGRRGAPGGQGRSRGRPRRRRRLRLGQRPRAPRRSCGRRAGRTSDGSCSRARWSSTARARTTAREHGRVAPGPAARARSRGRDLRPAVPAVRRGAGADRGDRGRPARPAQRLRRDQGARRAPRCGRGRGRRRAARSPCGSTTSTARACPATRPTPGVASLFRSQLAAGRAPRVFEDGAQRRDFVHVDDVARAVVAAAARPTAAGEVVPLNVGSGTVTTVGGLAVALADALGGPTPVVTGQFRVGDVRHVTASSAPGRAGPGVVGAGPARRGPGGLLTQSCRRRAPRAGQPDLEQAPGIGGLDADVPAVRGDDGPDDRQAEPGRPDLAQLLPVGAAALEPLVEDVRALVVGDPAARVLDGDPHLPVGAVPDDPDDATATAAAHGVRRRGCRAPGRARRARRRPRAPAPPRRAARRPAPRRPAPSGRARRRAPR